MNPIEYKKGRCAYSSEHGKLYVLRNSAKLEHALCYTYRQAQAPAACMCLSHLPSCCMSVFYMVRTWLAKLSVISYIALIRMQQRKFQQGAPQLGSGYLYQS